MSDRDNVLQIDLTPATASQMLAEIADDSSRVMITYHAEERMEERGITRTQVGRCLKHGKFTEGPYKSTKGNWEFTMEVASAGDVVSVVGALDWQETSGNYAVVITAYLG